MSPEYRLTVEGVIPSASMLSRHLFDGATGTARTAASSSSGETSGTPEASTGTARAVGGVGALGAGAAARSMAGVVALAARRAGGREIENRSVLIRIDTYRFESIRIGT